jgi:hypothetical protein
MNTLKLQWTVPTEPNPECSYNHTKAETPFGRFLLTWESWKDFPTFDFDETPWSVWGDPNGWGSMEEAQRWAAIEYSKRIAEAIKHGTELPDVESPPNIAVASWC